MDSDAGATGISTKDAVSIVGLLCGRLVDGERAGCGECARYCSSVNSSLVLANFFEIATSEGGFDPTDPTKLFHAVLLDIDHSPSHWLNPQNRAFYSEQGLQILSDKLYPGGIFALWSNDPPDADFTELLDSVFLSSEFHIISFPNPYQGGESSCTVYVAQKATRSN